ncbi:MAG: hypothetical protein A2096_10030 [Spirochaetes bacterium GWF1_41_5]|nr:MAG: hypothetical protein A2096_10030 [Spirochaetes bacterium GWF1_41_5]HBE00981.1 hypothetical protein [Spirochaetia bacterium]
MAGKSDFFDFLVNPHNRVFHIDTDCYIIYTGRNLEEDRDFIRIGTTADLSENLAERISHIIVPASYYLGSIFEENLCLSSKRSNNYLAFNENQFYPSCCRASEKIKTGTFCLRTPQYQLLPDSYESAGKKETPEQARAREKRVYFEPMRLEKDEFNFKIFYGKEPVFDFQKRLDNDLHRSRNLQNITDHFISRNINYYYERGFMLLSGSLAYYENNKFLLDSVPHNCLKEMIAANIDPCTIRALFTDQADQEYESLLQYFSFTQKPLTVYTRSEEQFAPLHKLFPPELICLKNPGDENVDFYGSALRHSPEKLSIAAGSEISLDFYRSVEHNGEKISLSAITIIPEKAIREFSAPQTGQIILVISGNDDITARFNLPAPYFKIFHGIDYRFSMAFNFKSRCDYPLDLYIAEVLREKKQSMHWRMGVFGNAVMEFISGFIHDKKNLTGTFEDVLKSARFVRIPKNHHEFILVHNSSEFLRFVNNSLEVKSRVIANLTDFLVKIKNRSAADIANINIKGNINLFPDHQRYLFYSMNKEFIDCEIPRYRNVLFQPGVENNLKNLNRANIEKNRQLEILPSFITNYLSRQKVAEAANHDAEEAKNKLRFFIRERSKLDGLLGFLKQYRSFSHEAKEQFYKIYTLQNMDEEDVADFDADLKKLDKYKFKSSRGEPRIRENDFPLGKTLASLAAFLLVSCAAVFFEGIFYQNRLLHSVKTFISPYLPALASADERIPEHSKNFTALQKEDADDTENFITVLSRLNEFNLPDKPRGPLRSPLLLYPGEVLKTPSGTIRARKYDTLPMLAARTINQEKQDFLESFAQSDKIVNLGRDLSARLFCSRPARKKLARSFLAVEEKLRVIMPTINNDRIRNYLDWVKKEIKDIKMKLKID